MSRDSLLIVAVALAVALVALVIGRWLFATLTYAIKRLQAYREKLAPVTFQDRQAMHEVRNASSVIAELDGSSRADSLTEEGRRGRPSPSRRARDRPR